MKVKLKNLLIQIIDDIKINIENNKRNINNGINEIIYGNPSKEFHL